MKKTMKKIRVTVSFAISLLFIVLIVCAWVNENENYNPNENELCDFDAVYAYLENTEMDMVTAATSKIGLYISSLSFETSNDVMLTGYIWQTIAEDDLDGHTFGVFFPESVDDTTLNEVYVKETDEYTTVGWYFQTTVRQQFDYSKYPLDHKTVWLRIMPTDFSSDLVLIPSLDSYDSTDVSDSFGISQDIVLIGWSLNETFFDYNILNFDTDFGLGDDFLRVDHPELSFNIVIVRDFVQAIIVNITLIIIIMILLYSLVLMITSEEDKLLDKFGVSASGAIGTASALFFSVLLAHIDLRNMFTGQLVYLEMFYYLAYFYILATSILVFVFMNELKNNNHLLVRTNARTFKLLYWPIYFGAIYLFTVVWM